MNQNDALGCLESKCRSYLGHRGHYIYKAPGRPDVLRSRNSRKVRYRWLLLVSEVSKRFLSIVEQMYIHHQLIQAKTRKEATYLVTGFVEEPGRIVVLPAEAALRAGHVCSDKGGIAWDDYSDIA